MVTHQRIRTLERQLQDVQAALSRIGDMQPGSLSRQFNVCGNPRCRCKADPPRKHGPYYQLSVNRKGHPHTKFVPLQAVSTVKRQLRNYAKFKTLVNRWIALATELCWLNIAQETPSS